MPGISKLEYANEEAPSFDRGPDPVRYRVHPAADGPVQAGRGAAEPGPGGEDRRPDLREALHADPAGVRGRVPPAGGRRHHYVRVELQIGRGETIEDSARIFSRFVDAVCWRTTAQSRLADFAEAGSIPVINILSDLEHPCQILADLFTIREKFGKRWPSVAYVGDGANNVANSWLLAAARLGMDFRIGHPEGYGPSRAVLARAEAVGRRTGAKLLVTRDPGRAVRGARVVYTDVWVSMGQEAEKKRRLRRFRGYQVNGRLLDRAARGAVVMHCLPAHRGEEITDAIMDGRRAIVFDQAENRLYNAQAVLLWCLKGGRS